MVEKVVYGTWCNVFFRVGVCVAFGVGESYRPFPFEGGRAASSNLVADYCNFNSNLHVRYFPAFRHAVVRGKGVLFKGGAFFSKFRDGEDVSGRHFVL